MPITTLLLVRHGESVANIAASYAEVHELEVIAAPSRDADVPLSPTGLEQAAALGRWLAARDAPPSAVWVSSYLRARQTAQLALDTAGMAPPVRVDERLRDRELGILDLLTSRGVEARYPEEAARRRWVGKFYYRPPGGESWADVALRLRSVLDDAERRDDGVLLVVAHDALVMLMLYLYLGLSEAELMEFALQNTVTNASVTTLVRSEDGWTLENFSFDEHLSAEDVPVTEHPGDHDAAH